MEPVKIFIDGLLVMGMIAATLAAAIAFVMSVILVHDWATTHRKLWVVYIEIGVLLFILTFMLGLVANAPTRP